MTQLLDVYDVDCDIAYALFHCERLQRWYKKSKQKDIRPMQLKGHNTFRSLKIDDSYKSSDSVYLLFNVLKINKTTILLTFLFISSSIQTQPLHKTKELKKRIIL